MKRAIFDAGIIVQGFITMKIKSIYRLLPCKIGREWPTI